MRLQINPVNQKYVTWLADLSYNPDLRDRIHLSVFLSQLRSIANFKERVFSFAQLQQSSFDVNFFRDRVILTFRNDVVIDFNADMLQKMLEELHVFDSMNFADVNEVEQSRDELSTEYLRSLSSAELSPARLCLKVKVLIILLRNLYLKDGLCNGIRMTVTQLGRRCIEARMLSDDFDEKLRLLPRIQLITTEGDLPFILIRK